MKGLENHHFATSEDIMDLGDKNDLLWMLK